MKASGPGEEPRARVRPEHLLTLRAVGDPDLLRNQIAAGFHHSARPDVPPWPFEVPIDWSSDPYRDRNWRFQFHAWYLLRPHFTLYERTGDPDPLRRMLQVALDWGRYHFDLGKSADFSWQDAATGRRAELIALLLDAVLWKELPATESDRAALMRLWREHFRKLTVPEFLSLNNHGLFQVHGLMALCQVPLDDEPVARGREIALDYMTTLLHMQFDDDGMHKEHSPEYHYFGIRVFRSMLRSGWYSDPKIVSIINKARKHAPWLLLPDGRYIPVGDSSTVAAFPRAKPVSAPESRPLIKAFDIGYAIVRSESSVLFLMGAFHSKVHKHADDLSIFWHEKGRDILIDPGKFGYNLGPEREYFLSTRAHNTVEIDETDFSREQRDAYGSAIEYAKQTALGYVIQAHVYHRGLEATHKRQLLYRPGRFLVIVDRLAAVTPRTYTQWLHFAADLAPMAADGGYTVDLGASGTLRLAIVATAPVEAEVVRGRKGPRMQGWSSRQYGEKIPATAIGSTCRAERLGIAAIFTFGAPGGGRFIEGAFEAELDGQVLTIPAEDVREVTPA